MPSDEEDLNTDTDRDGQEPEGLGPKGTKALDEERKARKAAEKRLEGLEAALKTERFGRLKEKNPWLEEDLLEGVDLDKWESRVSRLAAIAGNGAQPKEETPEEPIPAEAKDRLQSFAQQAGGSGPASQQTYTAAQIGEIGRKNPAEALRLIEQQKMRSPD